MADLSRFDVLGQYILDDEGEPKRVDLMTWVHWWQTENGSRIVLNEWVSRRVRVSTVFLALDHAFSGGPPILWETMIFGGVFHTFQARYRSKLAALAGHLAAVRLVECYRSAPRKTKKAMQKTAPGTPWERRRLHRREQRRLRRVLARLAGGPARLTA